MTFGVATMTLRVGVITTTKDPVKITTTPIGPAIIRSNFIHAKHVMNMSDDIWRSNNDNSGWGNNQGSGQDNNNNNNSNWGGDNSK